MRPPSTMNSSFRNCSNAHIRDHCRLLCSATGGLHIGLCWKAVLLACPALEFMAHWRFAACFVRRDMIENVAHGNRRRLNVASKGCRPPHLTGPVGFLLRFLLVSVFAMIVAFVVRPLPTGTVSATGAVGPV